MLFLADATNLFSVGGVSLSRVGLFLVQAFVISLTGVMAPGPMSATTLTLGARSRHAGGWIAVGHGIVEFPLMIGILAGAGRFFENPTFQIVVSFLGGGFLVWTAWKGIGRGRSDTKANSKSLRHNPVFTGILLSITNPYFLLWWATVGLGLIQTAQNLGMTAFVLFTLIHWMCDLVWLEAMSWSCFHGSLLLGERVQLWVLRIGSGAIAVFGVHFILQGVWKLVYVYSKGWA